MILLALALSDIRQTAETDMLKCFYAEAAALDDRVSDAGTIARAVVGACHPQFDDWKFANYAELRPLETTRFYADLERAASNIALQIVLKMRAKR
jgi:hypothetical protein